MNNKINIKWLVCVAMLGFHTTLSFAQQRSLKGRVVTSSGQPVAEAIISSPGCESVRTDSHPGQLITASATGCPDEVTTRPLSERCCAKTNAV